MPSVVLILFVIAVLMLCYGVSVIMRSLAEWRFFRKYPNSAARRHGRWWSPIVGIAMIGVCVLPAWFGFRWQEDLGADEFGWPHAVGLGLLIFAAWMLIVWGIGERARGRRWCPRCRYDMEGIDGLRCPECGKRPKHERSLRRARRPKWAARIAVLSLVLGGYTMWVARPMVEQGPLMAVPTWVLMAGWEWLPESWIIDQNGSDSIGRLEERFEHEKEISFDQRFQFADRLLDGMYRGEEQRWDLRRQVLLDAAIGRFSINTRMPYVRTRLLELADEHAELLDVIGVEVLEAAANPDAAQNSAGRNPQIHPLSDSRDHPYNFLRTLIGYQIKEDLSHKELSNLRKFRATYTAHQKYLPKTREVGRQLEFTFDQFDQGIVPDVVAEAGLLADHSESLFPTTSAVPERYEFNRRTYLLSVAFVLHDSDSIAPARNRLIALCCAGTSYQRAFANVTLSTWERFTRDQGSIPVELRSNAIECAIDSLNDTTVLWTWDDEDPPRDYTVRDTAKITIAMLDRTGTISMPLIRRWILAGEFSPYGVAYHPDATDGQIANWLAHVSEFARSDDVEIRRQITGGIPTRVGTPFDSEIDELLNRLVEDPDEDVRWEAESVLERREELRNQMKESD